MSQPRISAVNVDGVAHAFRELRAAEYPWTAEVTYLNNASIGPIPQRTRRLLDALSAKRAAPHSLEDRDLAGALVDARHAAAELINAEASEIALATNTSYGLNVAARGLPIQPGEIVLVPDGEFPANVYPWLLLQERGVRVELVPPSPQGWPDETYLLQRLEDPRVRVLAISLVQFANGFRADLPGLGAAARRNGTFVVVDAIQGIGQVPLDVRNTPVDVLSCGAQKWLLSPWGSGFFYVRRELLDTVEPPFGGWMAFEGTDDFACLTRYDMTPHHDARRFELVTLPFQDHMGMAKSVRMLLDLGIANIAGHLRRIRRPLLDAAARGAFEIVSPTDGVHESAIVCVRTRDSHASYRALVRAGVVSAFREGAIRFSPHWYNTGAEMERVAAILEGSE